LSDQVLGFSFDAASRANRSAFKRSRFAWNVCWARSCSDNAPLVSTALNAFELAVRPE